MVHGLTDEGSAPHIISVGIAGIRSEVLLHTLEEKRNLCFFRIGLLLQSSIGERRAQRNRSGQRIPGCHPAFQHVRVYNKRRN